MIDRNRKIVAVFARFAGLRSLIRLTGQTTLFPFYHTVSGQALPHVIHLYPLRTEQEFEADMDEMLRYFEPLSFSDYLERTVKPKGKPHMVLSFDDGLSECHAFIAPLLKKKGIPAAFFLNNHFIDNRGLFYRYKASILIDRIKSEPKLRERLAAYLDIPENRAVESILMIQEEQASLLEALLNGTRMAGGVR